MKNDKKINIKGLVVEPSKDGFHTINFDNTLYYLSEKIYLSIGDSIKINGAILSRTGNILEDYNSIILTETNDKVDKIWCNCIGIVESEDINDDMILSVDYKDKKFNLSVCGNVNIIIGQKVSLAFWLILDPKACNQRIYKSDIDEYDFFSVVDNPIKATVKNLNANLTSKSCIPYVRAVLDQTIIINDKEYNSVYFVYDDYVKSWLATNTKLELQINTSLTKLDKKNSKLIVMTPSKFLDISCDDQISLYRNSDKSRNRYLKLSLCFTFLNFLFLWILNYSDTDYILASYFAIYETVLTCLILIIVSFFYDRYLFLKSDHSTIKEMEKYVDLSKQDRFLYLFFCILLFICTIMSSLSFVDIKSDFLYNTEDKKMQNSSFVRLENSRSLLKSKESYFSLKYHTNAKNAKYILVNTNFSFIKDINYIPNFIQNKNLKIRYLEDINIILEANFKILNYSDMEKIDVLSKIVNDTSFPNGTYGKIDEEFKINMKQFVSDKLSNTDLILKEIYYSIKKVELDRLLE